MTLKEFIREQANNKLLPLEEFIERLFQIIKERKNV